MFDVHCGKKLSGTIHDAENGVARLQDRKGIQTPAV